MKPFADAAEILAIDRDLGKESKYGTNNKRYTSRYSHSDYSKEAENPFFTFISTDRRHISELG
jgi:hypothetical protein